MHLSERRILIVDDEPELRELLPQLLESLEIHFDSAKDGAEALDQALKYPYSAILSDINMPSMDGIQFMEKYIQAGGISPVVFLTGLGDRSKILQTLRLGAYDFLDKPCDTQRLIEVCGRAVEFGFRTHSIVHEKALIHSGKSPDVEESLKKIANHEKMLSLFKVLNHKKSQ